MDSARAATDETVSETGSETASESVSGSACETAASQLGDGSFDLDASATLRSGKRRFSTLKRVGSGDGSDGGGSGSGSGSGGGSGGGSGSGSGSGSETCGSEQYSTQSGGGNQPASFTTVAPSVATTVGGAHQALNKRVRLPTSISVRLTPAPSVATTEQDEATDGTAKGTVSGDSLTYVSPDDYLRYIRPRSDRRRRHEEKRRRANAAERYFQGDDKYSHRSTGSICLSLSIIAIIVAVIGIVAVAAYLAVQTTDEEGAQQYEVGYSGEFRVLEGDVYHPALANTGSEDFIRRATRYRHMLETLFGSSYMSEAFRRASVLRFGNSSLTVFFRIHLDRRKIPKTVLNTEEAVRDVITQEVMALQPRAFRHLAVDIDSIRVSRVKSGGGHSTEGTVADGDRLDHLSRSNGSTEASWSRDAVGGEAVPPGTVTPTPTPAPGSTRTALVTVTTVTSPVRATFTSATATIRPGASTIAADAIPSPGVPPPATGAQSPPLAEPPRGMTRRPISTFVAPEWPAGLARPVTGYEPVRGPGAPLFDLSRPYPASELEAAASGMSHRWQVAGADRAGPGMGNVLESRRGDLNAYDELDTQALDTRTRGRPTEPDWSPGDDGEDESRITVRWQQGSGTTLESPASGPSYANENSNNAERPGKQSESSEHNSAEQKSPQFDRSPWQPVVPAFLRPEHRTHDDTLHRMHSFDINEELYATEYPPEQHYHESSVWRGPFSPEETGYEAGGHFLAEESPSAGADSGMYAGPNRIGMAAEEAAYSNHPWTEPVTYNMEPTPFEEAVQASHVTPRTREPEYPPTLGSPNPDLNGAQTKGSETAAQEDSIYTGSFSNNKPLSENLGSDPSTEKALSESTDAFVEEESDGAWKRPVNLGAELKMRPPFPFPETLSVLKSLTVLAGKETKSGLPGAQKSDADSLTSQLGEYATDEVSERNTESSTESPLTGDNERITTATEEAQEAATTTPVPVEDSIMTPYLEDRSGEVPAKISDSVSSQTILERTVETADDVGSTQKLAVGSSSPEQPAQEALVMTALADPTVSSPLESPSSTTSAAAMPVPTDTIMTTTAEEETLLSAVTTAASEAEERRVTRPFLQPVTSYSGVYPPSRPKPPSQPYPLESVALSAPAQTTLRNYHAHQLQLKDVSELDADDASATDDDYLYYDTEVFTEKSSVASIFDMFSTKKPLVLDTDVVTSTSVSEMTSMPAGARLAALLRAAVRRSQGQGRSRGDYIIGKEMKKTNSDVKPKVRNPAVVTDQHVVKKVEVADSTVAVDKHVIKKAGAVNTTVAIDEQQMNDENQHDQISTVPP